jgi:tetratricopeptide (TPR) repeat protein
MNFTKHRIVQLAFMAAAALLVYQSCRQPEQSQTAEAIPRAKATYVGDDACVSCHKTQVDKWRNSHHYHAMEQPNAETVRAKWEGDFSANDQHYTFIRQGDKYLIVLREEGVVDTLEVAYTFGYEPLQQYLVKASRGRLQTLRASWDTEKNTWFNQYADQDIPRGDWMHFMEQSANWNGMCANCHSTDVTVGFNAHTESYHTTFSLINVSCESCHGPASVHIESAENETYTPDRTGFPDFGEGTGSYVNMCGGCHARREQFYDNVQPGHQFHNVFNLALLEERNYHPDGQIREEDYVLGSFLSSKMYMQGVQCSNCHDAHSLELIFDGNRLCQQCHEPEYDSPAHHFHEVDTEGAQCINCHMDGSTYMGNDYRRDHSFRIPRPDQSVAYGTPNACISCHSDKSDRWAADAVAKWYGPTRPDHFSDKLLAGWLDGNTRDLALLTRDTAYPAISRATAIFYLSQSDLRLVLENIALWLGDEDPLVRAAAIGAIRDFPADERLAHVNRALKDPSRNVRIAAYKSVLDVAADQIAPAYRAAFAHAKKEYETQLALIADFPDGQGQLGNYYFEQGKYALSIDAYKKALEIDSLRAELRTNLAIVYNTAGKNDKALIQLNRVIAQQPNAQSYYLRGLLKAEMGDLSAAATDLEQAIDLNPDNPSYYYNAVLTYSQMGKRSQARAVLQEALTRFPSNRRLRGLINSV